MALTTDEKFALVVKALEQASAKSGYQSELDLAVRTLKEDAAVADEVAKIKKKA